MWQVKAWFICRMIETDRGMGRTLRPLKHIISVALVHVSLLLYQPLWSTRALCVIATPQTQINMAVLEVAGHTEHVLELWLFQSRTIGWISIRNDSDWEKWSVTSLVIQGLSRGRFTRWQCSLFLGATVKITQAWESKDPFDRQLSRPPVTHF